jgi:hypothetical protein
MEEREFPIDYSDEVVDIFKKMSFTDGKNLNIYGSMSFRSILFPLDYDGYEIVENNERTKENYLNFIVKKFKDNIKKLEETNSTYISKIKCGEIKEWRILDDNIEIKNNKLINYNNIESKKKLENLYNKKLISKNDYYTIDKRLKKDISIKEYFELVDILDYHIVRWSPSDILRGYTVLLDCEKYYLKEAINSGMTKIDIIKWIDNKFTEFSCIYQFNYNNKPLNKIVYNIDYSLKQDILYYLVNKKYFKMTKRLYSYSKFKNDESIMDKLMILFNSNIGILYQIYGNIETLKLLFNNTEKIPYIRIKNEINEIKDRFYNITKNEKTKEYKKIINMFNNLDKTDILNELKNLNDEIIKILNTKTLKYLEKTKLYPLSKKYIL